jgi:2-amino-4-hydroxy-6-hydroxymethyldihydropteridine diphosphokinase
VATSSRLILISLGANLPARDGAAPLVTCQRAAAAIDRLPGLRLRGLSRWFATAPVLRPDASAAPQPAYVNAIAHVTVESGSLIEPALLLESLMAIEAQAGRVRESVDAPRVLDLDIVAMGDLVRSAPDPILPHPRAHQRAFVLVPLAEVAPHWVHPVLHRSVQALIADLPAQHVQPMEPAQHVPPVR